MPENRLERAQVEAYLEKFPSIRVCVLGDVMLDRYYWGTVARISPEAPVPIVRIDRRSARLGGAANVAANLRGVGVDVALAGVIGDDRAADNVQSLLDVQGIDCEWVHRAEDRETTEKVRIIAQGQQVVRADFEDVDPMVAPGWAGVLQRVTGDSDRFDALIISDYGKGVLNEACVREVIEAWHRRGKLVLVDPYVKHFKWYRGASAVTPNTQEAASYFDATLDRTELFSTLGFRMLADLSLQALLITRGEEGMSLFVNDREPTHIPTVAEEVYDVTGAGDTVIGILAAAMACGAGWEHAVRIANRAAGEVVKEVGTTIVTREMIVNGFI